MPGVVLLCRPLLGRSAVIADRVGVKEVVAWLEVALQAVEVIGTEDTQIEDRLPTLNDGRSEV